MDIFSDAALPAFIDGWQLIAFSRLCWGILLLGGTLGLAIGVFPGLGGIAGLSLVLAVYVRPRPCLWGWR